MTAAVMMYIRNEPPPRCSVCSDRVLVNKKFRLVIEQDSIRCNKHINTTKFFDYSHLENNNSNDYKILTKLEMYSPSTKIHLHCTKHNKSFTQSVDRFLRGDRGMCCYQLTRTPRIDFDNWVQKSKVVHNNRYDYSLSKPDYNGVTSQVKIICPVHGIFQQTANVHAGGHGCRKCQRTRLRTHDQFQLVAEEVHSSRYTYPLNDYMSSHEQVTIHCHKHGSFQQVAYIHLAGSGCPKCATGLSRSKGEDSICKFLEEEAISFSKNNRDLGTEIDLYIPDHKIGIEYNGLYWHSSGDKTTDQSHSNRHLTKTEIAESNGIKLFHIFEHEWSNAQTRDIWKSVILKHCGLTRQRVYARLTTISQVQASDARKFYDRTHLQGFCGADKHWALIDQSQRIVSMMSVSSTRFDRRQRIEIIRASTELHTVVSGGFSRLLKHIRKIHPGVDIVSFANRRWSCGDVYRICGFELDKVLPPCYYYTNMRRVWHRTSFMKKALPKKLERFDPNLTEYENMYLNGYRRIWDSGHLRYTLKGDI